MDKHTLVLLQAEADVKRKVTDAQHKKTEQLKSIKREAEVALMDFRKNQETDFQIKLANVSKDTHSIETYHLLTCCARDLDQSCY